MKSLKRLLPALVQTAKSNAAARVQLHADLWTQICGVLTPAQQARIPGILAAEKSARAAHEAVWKAHHDGQWCPLAIISGECS